MPRKTKQDGRAPGGRPAAGSAAGAKYPRHTVDQALRVPRAIIDQGAGKACTVKEAAAFVGIGAGGEFSVEVSSGIKYGLLDRPEPGKIQPSDRARRIIRPKTEQDEV